MFAYKGFILLAGLFLAFETHRIKIKSLNESRFIAMSVYGAVIVSVALHQLDYCFKNSKCTIWNTWNNNSAKYKSYFRACICN